ncbi:DoxX family membrane protein [Actinocrinis puniceicyclus]|uniref:DoxX family membrane protein n=1 Tax=Actinocrinis puniceicyclus TaxID=977794 RepID=A0A8J7WMZ5_9ACTN|nr:MauE/DoxX family redox-associated membrane protein [Actinocrinis puniceicyclus]MBS2962702.1 DoxX family membrane protein [Actinocrinis puniceicyclus]
MTSERGTAAGNGTGGQVAAGKGAASAQAEAGSAAAAPRSALAGAAPWISLAARLLLGAMWLFYCLPKLGTPDANVASVRNFQILPGGMVNAFAYAQPYVELALGLLAIAGLGTRLVAGLSALLLLTYIGGIVSLGARGIHITCGCGGSGGQVAVGRTRYTMDVLRDLAYLVPAAWLLWRPKSKFSADALLLPEPASAAPVPTPRRSAPAKGGPSRR